MNVRFPCPNCEHQIGATVDAPGECRCPACDQLTRVDAAIPALPTCVVCGNHELYKQKDFPHWLGMTILIVALVASTVTYYSYQKWWSWSFLIGSALIDGVMYLLVGDVIVCYRCDAQYRGFTAGADHHPFEIEIGERYRQERIRRERLKK